MANTFKWDDFNKMPVIGIMRNFPEDKIDKTLHSFYMAGLTTIELTMNSANAKECISSMVAEWGDKLNIGAGTVCSLQDMDDALAAGAQFIVTPVINEEVIIACVKKGVPIFPGAFTPSEIYKAWSLGASMVKVFPAAKLGPGYIKEVLAPLNKVRLVATGGITADNFIDFFKAGVQGTGVGSNLFPQYLLDDNLWDELTIFLSGFVHKYNEFVKSK